jgi:ribosomal protein S15P/S13E
MQSTKIISSRKLPNNKQVSTKNQTMLLTLTINNLMLRETQYQSHPEKKEKQNISLSFKLSKTESKGASRGQIVSQIIK